MSAGFGQPFADALAAAGPAAGPALQSLGAAAADPHAAMMNLAVAAAQGVARDALAGDPAAGQALAIADAAAAGAGSVSSAVAAAAALAPSAAAATSAVAPALASVAQGFSPKTDAVPAVSCTPPAATPATNPAVEIVWPPNRGFDGPPEMQTLAPGTQLSRYGGWVDEAGQFQDKGSFVAPAEVPYGMRALPAGTDAKPLSTYEVLKPIEQVPSGPALPWFGEPGGGMQHELPMSINALVAGGYLKTIGRTIPG